MIRIHKIWTSFSFISVANGYLDAWFHVMQIKISIKLFVTGKLKQKNTKSGDLGQADNRKEMEKRENADDKTF